VTRALELIPLVLGAESGGKMADPVAHVVNHPAVWNESGLWLWSAHMGNLVLSGLLLVLVMSWAARHISTKPSAAGADKYITRNPLAHMIEVICVFLRDQTVRPLLGERTDRFMPFLWTLFFFILINNLLGLVPLMDLQHLVSPELRRSHTAWVGGTATQSLFVTGVLALIAFVVVNVAGIRELGLKGYLRHLTGGAPVFIWPILVPVEVMGIFIRPVALALRLFANMTAGHILVATLPTSQRPAMIRAVSTVRESGLA